MNNNDYLKTPEHFKMLVESKVNEQLNTPISDKKKPTTSIQAKKEKSGYHFKKIAAGLLQSSQWHTAPIKVQSECRGIDRQVTEYPRYTSQ